MTTGDNLVELLPAVKTVSFIRAKQPAIYVFAGGNEDAALFSVNDFSLLIDGGDEKVVPYWNLIRNYEKVSALIATRPSPESLRGIATMLQRKAVEQCSPHIGAVIANLPPESAVTGDSDVAQLIKAFYDGLLREGLKLIEAQAGTKLEPITLYEVIGEGSLRMIIMNPEKGSKELLALSAAVKNGGNVEKISAAASTAFLLVWSPADPTKKTVRILYPGACPLEKLYASLEKLKVEECLRYPEYILADKAKYVVQKSANRSRPFSARVSSKNANPPTVSSGVTKTPARPATRPSAVTHTRAPADLPRTPATTNKTMPSTKPIAKKPISRTTATTRVSHTSTAVRRVPSPTKTSPGQTSPIRKPNSPTKAAGPATNRKAVENNKSTKEAKQSEKKTDRALPLSQPEVAIKSDPNVSEASNCAKELESSASDSTNRKVMSTDEVNGNRPMSTPSESTVIASDAKLTEPSDMDFTPIHVVAPEAMSDHVPESVATQKCVPEILSNSAVVSSFSEETGKSDSHSAVIPHEDNLSGTLAPSPESSTETPCDHVIVEPAAEYQKIPDTSPVLSPHAAHIEHLDETHPAFLNNISEEVQSSDQSAKNFLNNNALFGKSSGGDICLSSAEHLPSIPSHPSVKSESGVSNVGGRDPARDIENFEEDHLNESVRQHEPILSFEESERLTIKEHISSYGPDKPGMLYDHVESDFDDEHPEDSCHTEAEKMITTKTEAPMASESSDMVHHKPPDQPESVPVSTDLPLKSHLQEVAAREEAAHHTSEILPHDSVEQFETDSMSTSRIEREICQEQPTVRASVQTSDNHTENHEEIRESVQSAKIVVDSDTSTKDLRPSDLEIPDMAAVTPADPRVSDHATVSSPKHHQTPIRSPQNEDTSRKSSLELLSAPTTPFTAGLVASIVESASSECLEKQDKLDFKNMPIPPELEQISGAPGYYGEAVSSGITPSTPSNGVSPNSDHLDQYSHATKHVADPTAHPPPTPNDVNMNGLQMVQTQADPTDPLLDDVIDDLVDESELMYTSSKQRADNFDSGMLSEKSAVHETRSTVERPLKSDDDLFKMQQATEDAFAKNMHLPPIPHRPVPRLNGSNTTAKHKLSQPLYFDAVFVPHHGARPLLHDETAAKLFATSIRSKRYILSGKDAIRPYIIDGIMGAKLLWDIPSNMNTQMSVDVVPTHDSTELTGYNMQKASEMSEAGIRLHCSVERCTLKLSSEETNDVCSGFKFEM